MSWFSSDFPFFFQRLNLSLWKMIIGIFFDELRMRKIMIFFVVAGFLLAVSGTASGTLVDGGERLIEMQNTDGGWGWELTGASATNSAGPCGSGLLSVYSATGDVKYLNAAIKTGEFVIAQPGDTYTYRPLRYFTSPVAL